MPVNTTHTQFKNNSDRWMRIRDVLGGSDLVKDRGQIYLPKPGGHTDDDYAGYKIRAEFYPASQRTVDGLAGAIFRKDPIINIPDNQTILIERTTLRGADFTTFSKSVVREVLAMGRFGVLVDVIGEEKEPYSSGYVAENIINWRYMYAGREPKLQLVVLREWVDRPVGDGYETELVERFRVLELGTIEGAEEGPLIYQSTLWEATKSKDGKEEFMMIEQVIPKRRGKPLDRIPFHFFGAGGLEADVEKSPMLDLVDTNISHYRTSAELEEGAYYTGLPMYVVSGRPQGDGEMAEFRVGSRSALMLDEGGRAEVLTVPGQGMGLLQEMMASKERRMAVLGARILEDQKSGVESSETVMMRHRGENSLLSSISDNCSRGLKAVLSDMSWWMGQEDPEVEVALNRDFVSSPMMPKEIVEMTASLQQGSIGPEVFFLALKEGERIPNNWTIEDWLKDIDEGSEMFGRDILNESDDDDDNVVPIKGDAE